MQCEVSDMTADNSQTTSAERSISKTFFALTAAAHLSLVGCVTYLVVADAMLTGFPAGFWPWLIATLIFMKLKNRWARRRWSQITASQQQSR